MEGVEGLNLFFVLELRPGPELEFGIFVNVHTKGLETFLCVFE